MASVVELLPMTRISYADEGATYEQPLDSVVDVSGYTEASIIITVVDGIVPAATTTIVTLQTAHVNRDEQWVDIVTLNHWDGVGQITQTENIHNYIAGTSNNDNMPGFGRYLRLKITQGVDAHITLSVMAMLKP